MDQAAASVVIHKGILVFSLVLYILVGLALAPLYLPAAFLRVSGIKTLLCSPLLCNSWQI